MRIVGQLLLSVASIFAATIVETAQATPDLSTLVTVLTMADYKPVLDALNGPGPMTVFAPTNDAFTAAGVDVTNVEAVSAVLKYHVIAGAAVYSNDLQPDQDVDTLNGASVNIKKSKAGVIVNDEANVVLANVTCSNGVVHVIDRVLLPPDELPTIVAAAQATPDLTTLVSVITMADYQPVLDALSGNGPMTVFAPTNDAFTAAGIDVSDVQAVTAVLQYHVIAGAAVFADQLTADQDVDTLNGASVNIKKSNAGVIINDVANVVTPDVACSNGVVHVIDKVLMPPSAPATTTPVPGTTTAAPGTTTTQNADTTTTDTDVSSAFTVAGGSAILLLAF